MSAEPVKSARPWPLTIACFGELVWDEYEGAEAQLGGSATAIAAHLVALGARARLVSVVGPDALGARARAELCARGVDVSGLLTSAEGATGRLRVSLRAGEPRYERLIQAAFEAQSHSQALSAALTQADGLVFNAFVQGKLTDLDALGRSISKQRPRWVGCDLNLRREVGAEWLARLLALCDYVKLNEHELGRLQRSLAERDALGFLLGSGRCKLVALTRGSQGARLYDASALVVAESSAPAELLDAVGAGDAFMAAFTLELLSGAKLRDVIDRACRYAALHVTRSGALPARSP